jgi:hypothetical protein
VYDGSLAPGDIVTIVLGDRSQGSPGIPGANVWSNRVTICASFVDPTNACSLVQCQTSRPFPIVFKAKWSVSFACNAKRQRNS